MRMGERKQDALSTNFLIGLMDEVPKKKEPTLHVDVRRRPTVKGDATLEHLASRIVEEVTVSSSPRQLATKVLNNAGIDTRTKKPQTEKSHLRHVGQRARKIPRNPVRKVRKVKRAVPERTAPQRRRGPPSQTRNRPAMGAEQETAPPPRRVRSSKKRQSRRGLFRR